MAKVTYEVRKSNDGWSIKKRGATRASRREATKADAVKVARELAARAGAAIVVYKLDGKVGQRIEAPAANKAATKKPTRAKAVTKKPTRARAKSGGQRRTLEDMVADLHGGKLPWRRPSNRKLDKLEALLGTPLPAAYRTFLACAGDRAEVNADIALYALANGPKAMAKRIADDRRQLSIPAALLPIGTFWNEFIVLEPSGKVGLWNYGTERIEKRYPWFGHFVSRVLAKNRMCDG